LTNNLYRYIIKDMNGKEAIKILKKNGWKVLRVRGSHHQMGKGDYRTTVPVHGNRDLGKDLLKEIERQTGVTLS